MNAYSLISSDIHGLIQVRKPQARVIKYMRNRVLLISSQTIRIISKVNNQQQENDPENQWNSTCNPTQTDERCKTNQNEKGMRRIWIKREQETHPKLTCSCLLSLLSPSLVSSPLRSMEPASSLLCDSPNGCLSPVRLPPRISFFSHVSIFHRKPLCPLLHVPSGGYLHHQHGVSAPL